MGSLPRGENLGRLRWGSGKELGEGRKFGEPALESGRKFGEPASGWGEYGATALGRGKGMEYGGTPNKGLFPGDLNIGY